MSMNVAPKALPPEKHIKTRPFLKWVGGKTQLIAELVQRIPKSNKKYYEPFLGGAAFFFHLKPDEARLSDVNEELINVYLAVRDHVDELVKDLRRHKYEEDYFYQVRNLDRVEGYQRLSSIQRASRFIYLNKTCFNGLYRVNAKGHFNVPFGQYVNPKILDEPNLRACHQVLQGVDIQCSGYLEVLAAAEKGDFVYLDPPYVPLSVTSSFTNYSKDGFSSEDQIGLRDACSELDRRGVEFMLSNSSAPFVLDLYKGFKVEFVSASRAVNSKASGRGKVQEVIVTNY